MAANVTSIRLPGDTMVKIVKWKVKPGTRVNEGTILLIYEPEESDTKLKLRSESVGTVTELLAKEGHVMPAGSIVAQMRGCDHPIVMKDMCAECGADLRDDPRRPGLRRESTSASVAMVHSVPELIISEENALEIGKADEQRLLSCRKLVLLVDLDQTILHTTNDNIPPNLKDVYHFQLWHNNSWLWYHTKFRPGTERFLENMSKLYEMHICTFGVRLYAHKIASFMDPDGKHFSHRILSRDECFHATSKTANLKALFPCGDSLVCIIDDREDVWNFAKNLVHVKPYHFFVGTADINAPPGMSKNDEESKLRQEGQQHSIKEKEEPNKDETSNAPPSGSDGDTTDTTDGVGYKTMETSNAPPSGSDGDTTDTTDGDKTMEIITDEKMNTEQEHKDTEKKEDLVEWNDSDDYLVYLEEILTRIHKAYYDLYDEMKIKDSKCTEIPDFKNIVPYVKRKTLKGCNIVFSGVFPLQVPPEKCREYYIAKSLGAVVQLSFVPDVGNDNQNATTHLIAARIGTDKVKQAQKYQKVCIVTPEWLYSCNDRWEHVDERLFPLTKDTKVTLRGASPDVSQQQRQDERGAKRKLDESSSPVYDSRTDEITDTTKRSKTDATGILPQFLRHDFTQTPGTSKMDQDGDSDTVILDSDQDAETEPRNKFSRSYNPLLSLSSDEIEDMDKEVEDILSSDDSDEERREDDKAELDLRRRVLSGDESNSSSGESLSGDYPRGWKRKHQKKSFKNVTRDNKNVGHNNDNVGDEESEKSFHLNDDSESDSGESIGSVDEAMAAEVEKLISR